MCHVALVEEEGVEVASLRTVSAESGGQSLAWKTAYVHSVEVA